MLREEAAWIASVLAECNPTDISPMLNIGSSTAEFRKSVQPWINTQVFATAHSMGIAVVHLDMKPAEGVDIVGDLLDPEVLSKLAGMRFGSVLCSNVLEHVTTRAEICQAIESLVDAGGTIVVTCPYRYPYHPDPIDTWYRPTPDDIALLFPSSEVIRQQIVDCGTHFSRLVRDPRRALRTLVRLCLPFYKTVAWLILLRSQAWMFRQFQVSCVVLRRRDLGRRAT